MKDIKIEKIIRTKRKTIGLQITDDATLIIKVPYHIGEDEIKNILLKHKNWINKKVKKIKERKIKYYPKKFIEGEKFLFLGKYYKLKIEKREELKLNINEKYFVISEAPLALKKRLFTEWYKKNGYKVISERVKYYVQKYGFSYNKINITDAKKRWGSCSPSNNLNFSLRLIMAPIDIVDYVIVHELCHLKEKNHGKSFWRKVKSIMPDYKEKERWLKENGYFLRF